MNMSIKNTLKMALKSISSNKLRTFLTMLGIIIGVFSVIVMISIGQGATANVTASIEGMGSNLLTLSIRDRTEKFNAINISELALIEGVDKLSPSINWSATAKNGLESIDSLSVIGANENYLGIQNYKLAIGRFINPIDVDYRNKVVIIGSETAATLFGELNPINEEISLNGIKFTVVGVLSEKASSMIGNSNDLVIIPYSTGMRQFKSNLVSSVVIQGKDAETATQTLENIEKYLLNIYSSSDSYNIFNQEELLSTLNSITGTLTMMLGGIAGISLLVGGIGIMNIMLVTVTERTREIGIRKAIGARRSNILTQFLIESSVISCLGGVIGIVLGIIVNKIISSAMSINAVMNINVVVIAFGFSLFVGIFFGMYPANKASKLKPVDALRYE